MGITTVHPSGALDTVDVEKAVAMAAEQPPPRRFAICGTRTRFLLLVVTTLCLTSVWSNILTFNFAVICMEPPDNHTIVEGDDEVEITTTTQKSRHIMSDTHVYTTQQRMWAMFAVAAAALVGNFVTVQLIARLQIRSVFAALGIISGIATCLIPLTIDGEKFALLLVLRALQGFAFSGNFPVVGEFSTKWTYFKQSGLVVSTLVSYIQIAPAITMPLSGALCTNVSWQSVFYLHGGFSIIIFTLFFLLYRNTPAKHPLVHHKESIKISIGKTPVANRKQQMASTPYLAILKTPAVWAVWIASFGTFATVNLVFLYSPTFMSEALGYSVNSAGITSAIPPLAEFIIKVFCGAISDKIKFIPETIKYRLFNTVAYLGCAIFLVITALVAEGSSEVVVTLVLTIAVGILGANTGGFYKNGSVISRQYSHFVMGYVSLGLTITMLIVPFFVSGVAPKNTVGEWRIIFFTVAGVMVVTNVIYCILMRAEPCEWTKDSWLAAQAAKKKGVAGPTDPNEPDRPPVVQTESPPATLHSSVPMNR